MLSCGSVLLSCGSVVLGGGGLGGLSTKQLGTSVGQAFRFCVLLPRSSLISFLQPTPAVGDCMKNVVLRTPLRFTSQAKKKYDMY